MNFRRWVVFTFLVHVLVIAVDKGGGLILYLLTAEHSDQHGEASILASLPFIVGAIANLGLATAMVYFVRRGRFTAQQCFETAMSVALVWGGLVAAAAAVFTLYVLPALRADVQVDPWLVLPWCAVVPLLLLASYANSTQLATERVRDYGVVHVVTSVAFLPAFFACFFWLGGKVEAGHVPYAVTWGRLISTALVAALALWMVRRVVQLRLGVHREFLREGVRYGWKANLTSTLTYLNHRIDLLVLAQLYLAPPGLIGDEAKNAIKSQVAFYSMAVTWAELVWHFPEAMRDLFFSKVAGSSHEKAREMTPILARLGLAISVLAGGVFLLLLNPVMGTITAIAKGSDLVWLRDWSPTVSQALLVLTPGTMAYTVSKVLQADLAGRNHLQTCVNAQLVVLVTMLGLDVLWMPAHGAVGAAAASTVAYVVSTGYTVAAYSRQTGIAWWRCIVAQPSDFVYIREIVQAVWSKLRRRRT